MVDNADIVQVFAALQAASQTRHLPALEGCAPQSWQEVHIRQGKVGAGCAWWAGPSCP